MPSAADIAAEMDEGLKALFQAGLELSLQMQADAMGADSAEDRSKLALSFHRISRSVRQTAALRMKIAREAERAGREASAEVVRLDTVRLAKRRSHVKAEVESLIWSEAENAERETYLNAELEDLLEIEAQDEDTFLAEPAEAQIRRLAYKIGLDLPNTDTPPQTVIPRSGGTPDPGDPEGAARSSHPIGLAQPAIQLGSPASPCGRAWDDVGLDGASEFDASG